MTDFQYSGNELDSLAEARNYYSWVLRQFEPYLGPEVIEAGAGIGTFSEFLLSSSKVKHLTAIEPASNTYPHLEARFRGNPGVTTRKGYLSEFYKDLKADAIVAVNVLEHIEDHELFLKEAHSAINPGGALLLFVPALPAIFGTLDKAFEHYRRYTRRSLREVIAAAGWSPKRVSYMNFPGIAAWFMAGRVMKKTSIAVNEAKTYDRLVVPILSRVETMIEPPIGSNLVAIATKS
ncbi:MAG TPA: class I SAM-dependent methyltransferase [Gemmatimonadaceae bacterium]|nr:class I SAM-dependent methyltransferase [Gemmatimonadaceae bacterium]